METPTIKSMVGDAPANARSFVMKQIDDRLALLSEELTNTADGVRAAARSLQTDPNGDKRVAQFATFGADTIGRMGTYLDQKDPEQILHDVEDFARERPWTLAAAAFSVGLGLSRMLKASSADRYRRRSMAASS